MCFEITNLIVQKKITKDIICENFLYENETMQNFRNFIEMQIYLYP